MLAASHGRLPFPIGTNGAAVRRRAAPSSLYTRRRGLRCPRELPRSVRRRAGSRAQSVACAALLAATLAAPLVCPLLARSGYVPPPAAAADATPPPIHSGPWVQVGVSAFRFRSAIHGGHF
jgi:hypothetical protein